MPSQDAVGTKGSTVADIASRLKRQEETTQYGANLLTPKQQLLDATDAQRKNPELRVRWVSLKNADKALTRRMEGYTVLTDEQGGKRLGDDLVLMGINREKYEARVKYQDKLAKDRLKQHKNEMQAMAEQMAKQLRDNHGIDIDVDRLLVSEES